MLDLRTRLRMLERPALLVRTARHGLAGYRRDRDLRVLLRARQGPLPPPTAATLALLDREHAMNRARLNGDPRYAHHKHVALLIGLMAESRIVLARRPQ